MILIVSSHDDEHALAVSGELRRRGVAATVLDLAEFPKMASVSVSFEPGRPFTATVDRASVSFDLDDVEAIWLRRLSAPDPPPMTDRWYSVSETHHALVGLAQALHDRRWVNRLGALALDGGWGKIRQLEVAQAVGFEIPRTLATNDPEKARAFVASCPGGSIYKPFASREGRGRDGVVRAIYTTEVSVETDLRAVAHAPCVFQEKIPKRVELRATVVGDRVFACEIHSQTDPASLVDYRRRYLAVPRKAHVLPAEVEDRLLRLHRSLGLVFGTADLILRPDGVYVFLETNQQGQWAWTADVFGDGVLTGAFCDLLTGAHLSSPEPSA